MVENRTSPRLKGNLALLVFGADGNVISITHEDHVVRGLVPSPGLGPEVE
jgi:hypothetical protein